MLILCKGIYINKTNLTKYFIMEPLCKNFYQLDVAEYIYVIVVVIVTLARILFRLFLNWTLTFKCL